MDRLCAINIQKDSTTGEALTPDRQISRPELNLLSYRGSGSNGKLYNDIGALPVSLYYQLHVQNCMI